MINRNIVLNSCVGILLWGFSSYGQEKELTINISLQGLNSPNYAILYRYNGNLADTIAKQKITNGISAFNVSVQAEPSFYFLKISSLKETLPLFVGAGKVDIDGEIFLWPTVQVVGSLSHKDYQNYHLLTDSLENIGQTLINAYKTAQDLSDTTTQSALQNKIINKIQAYENRQLEFVSSHSNSFYSPVVINNAKWDWTRKRAAYEKLSTQIKKSKYGIFLAENIAKWKKASGLLEIGDTVPEFVASTADNTELSLQRVLAGNKLTLIDFWASWCVPCRQEHPNLVKTYKENKGKGFDIISVSLDDKQLDWKQATAKDGLLWQQVSDLKGLSSPIAELYFAGMPFNFIPQNFLVDTKGKILARNLRGNQLSKKVAELLKGNTL